MNLNLNELFIFKGELKFGKQCITPPLGQGWIISVQITKRLGSSEVNRIREIFSNPYPKDP